MKQALQGLRTGSTIVEYFSPPILLLGQLLSCTSVTFISAGTERMVMYFEKGNLIAKARQQPDNVKQVFAIMRTDGIVPAVEAVWFG